MTLPVVVLKVNDAVLSAIIASSWRWLNLVMLAIILWQIDTSLHPFLCKWGNINPECRRGLSVDYHIADTSFLSTLTFYELLLGFGLVTWLLKLLQSTQSIFRPTKDHKSFAAFVNAGQDTRAGAIWYIFKCVNRGYFFCSLSVINNPKDLTKLALSFSKQVADLSRFTDAM